MPEVIPDSYLSVTTTEQGLQLKGDLVYASVSDVVKAGGTLLKKHQGHEIIINCGSIARVDSAGISLLLEWRRLCIQLNKSFQIEGLPQQAVALIKTYKLNNLLALS